LIKINIETLVSKRINEVNQVFSEAKNPSLAKSNAVDVFSEKPSNTYFFQIPQIGILRDVGSLFIVVLKLTIII